jgi:uncharacterized protein with HEPN domain
MRRELNAYLSDILNAIKKIEKYTIDLTFDDFIENELVQDGVVRNLEVIGEAVKKIPEDVRRNRSQIDWRKIAGLRDILIHEYFAIDFGSRTITRSKKISDTSAFFSACNNREFLITTSANLARAVPGGF